MKKIDFGAPPPPPPELPRPVPTELYSPTQYSGVQQYSPSRATSPGSEDEKPPPPTAASLPPRKVLGSDQAKRRLQAFAKSKLANSPKGKVSAVFAEEEDEAVKEKVEKKKGPMVKDSTPVMASIMKEETANRETIKKNIEKIKQKAEESDSDVRRKDDEGRRFIEENSDMDLRDLLKKKREVSDTTKESSRGGGNRRSRSKEGGRGRSDRRRLERSPRNSKTSSSENRDRSRKGRDSVSSERNKKERDESPGGKKRRGREKSRNRKSSVEDRDLRREEKNSNRKFKEDTLSEKSPVSSEKIARAFGTVGSGKKDYSDESPSSRKYTDIVERKSKRRGSRDNSGDRKDTGVKEENRRRESRRSPSDREGKRIKEKSVNKRGDRKSPETGRKFSSERKNEKNLSAGDLKGGISRAFSQSRDIRSVGDLKGLLPHHQNDKGRDADDSWSEENHKKMNFTPENKIIENHDQLYPTDKAKSEKHQSTKKDIDLWELKHGNQSLRSDKVKKVSENDNGGGNFNDQSIYIRAASEEDYQEVKQETRDTTGFVHNKDGVFIEFPRKFMQETTSGITWSYNLEVCRNLDIEKKKSARIRKSIDSMVSELEHETMKKRSRENSVHSDKPEPVKKKKKKKSSKGEDTKKDKKKKKAKREDASNKKLKKKRKKRDKDMDLDEDIFLPDLSLDLDRSMTSTNASPDPKRKRVHSGGSSVPLSAAGMSKLFSMAGYDPSTKDNEMRADESESKGRGLGSLSPSPLKSKKAGSSRAEKSPSFRSTSRHSNTDQRSEKIMYEMPRRSLSERSPSPSLRGDLSRISGPRTPSPGPRLPKMKDSRSPSKVPIMRDRRSPLKRSPGREVKSRDLGNEYKKSPEKFESPKKKDGRRNQRSREGSPIGQYMTEEDFIGTNYDGLGSKREERGRYESPRSSQHSGSSRRAIKSPGRFVSPGPSPRGSISSHKSEEERYSSSKKRKAGSPEQRSLLDEEKYSKRTLDERSSSSLKVRSPGLVYNPINESRDYSPDRMQYDTGRKDRLDRKLFSPVQGNISPGRRLDSPERHPVSPDNRQHAESGRGREEDKRHLTAGHINRSPRRRSSGSPKKSPAKRARTPEKNNVSDDRAPRSPDRRHLSHSGSRERRQGISDRHTRSPNRRSRTPDKKHTSLGRSPMGRARSQEKREYIAEHRSSNQDSTPKSSGGRNLVDLGDRQTPSGGRKETSPDGRRRDSPIGTRTASPHGRRQASPGRGKLSSPGGRRLASPDVRRQASPGGRRLASPRRPISPGGRRPISPGGRRPGSPGGKRQLSPDGRRPSSPGARRLVSPGGRIRASSRERRPTSPGRRVSDSPGGRRPGSPRHGSPNRRPESPRRRPRSPPSGQSNVDRRAFSPERGYERRPYSPDHRSRARSAERLGPESRQLSPDHRRQKSPRDRRSPVPHSPGRRGYASPGRGRRPRTPPYSPGRRVRTPESRRLSPERDRRPHSPGRDRRPYSPDRDRRPRSPERRPHSPARRRFSPSYDPRDRSLPDSTISDADLARQMPPPSLHYKYKQFPPLASPAHTGYSDSPKRLSLDERLEREHGIRIEHEQTPPMDFSRPPPGFPSVQPHYPPAMLPSGPQQHATPLPFSTGLPAMMPTYDDSAPPTPVKGPPYPGTQKVANEKEQAIIAAQAVASKLQEMQAAIEDERKKKKEQKMAERMAQMDAAKKEEKVLENKVVPVKATTGRIFDEVEKQEIEMKEKDVKLEIKDSEKKKHEEKRKKRKDKDSPLLITLKPFYRPNDRKDKKKRKVELPEADLTDEEFVPRSPVPLPDNSSLKPVLIKPNQTKLKIISEGNSDKKGVKYADGVLPGQGSPDQDFSPPPPSTTVEKPVKKRYKKVTITVITQHVGDTDSDEEGPPPPPPGSPPRYHLKDLIAMYGTPRPVGSSA